MKIYYLLPTILLLNIFVAFNQETKKFSGEAIFLKDIPATLPFFDDFEDGDISDYDDLGGTIVTEASTTTAANGNYSVYINGGSFGTGLARTFENSNPKYISLYVKTTNIPSGDTYSGAAYIEIGDSYSNEAIFFLISGSRNCICVYNVDLGQSEGKSGYELDRWYFIEFKDISFSAQTFDFYVDNVMYAEDVPFRNSMTEFGYFELHNYIDDNPSKAYWDDIYISNNSPVSINEVENKNISIYPNPASDEINIESHDIIHLITLTDMSGKTLIETIGDSENLILDLSSVSSGIYFVFVQTNKGKHIEKIIKE